MEQVGSRGHGEVAGNGCHRAADDVDMKAHRAMMMGFMVSPVAG